MMMPIMILDSEGGRVEMKGIAKTYDMVACVLMSLRDDGLLVSHTVINGTCVIRLNRDLVKEEIHSVVEKAYNSLKREYISAVTTANICFDIGDRKDIPVSEINNDIMEQLLKMKSPQDGWTILPMLRCIMPGLFFTDLTTTSLENRSFIPDPLPYADQTKLTYELGLRFICDLENVTDLKQLNDDFWELYDRGVKQLREITSHYSLPQDEDKPLFN